MGGLSGYPLYLLKLYEIRILRIYEYRQLSSIRIFVPLFVFRKVLKGYRSYPGRIKSNFRDILAIKRKSIFVIVSNFLKAEWRKLVMFNYAVEPALLLHYVPAHTELDLWNNTCYVSLVGFMFHNTKVKGIKIPFHINFEEINLRFYVKYVDPKLGKKRGVVFIKEIVPKPMITWVANTIYREHYITLPMKHKWDIKEDLFLINYSLKKNKDWFNFGVSANNNPQQLLNGSEEEFITEHFWGYVKWDEKQTNEYEVGHPRWVTYPIVSSEIDFDFEKIYGSEFGLLNNAKPVSVFLAEGSEIFVNKGKVIS